MPGHCGRWVDRVLTLHFVVPQTAAQGQYYAVASVWPGFDEDTYEMVGPRIYDTRDNPSWDSAGQGRDGIGFRCFSLGQILVDNDLLMQILVHLQSAGISIDKDGAVTPEVALDTASYKSSHWKPLLYVSGSPSISKTIWIPGPQNAAGVPVLIPVALSGGGEFTFLIDLADLFNVTPEGKDYVTCWFDAGIKGSIGLGIGSPAELDASAGIALQYYDWEDRALGDFRESWSVGLGGTAIFKGWAITFVEYGSDGLHFFKSVEWDGSRQLGLKAFGSTQGLIGFEVNKRAIIECFNLGSTPSTSATAQERVMFLSRAIFDKVLQLLPSDENTARGEAIVRRITYDDGDYPLYDGIWESPLTLSRLRATFPWNTGDLWKREADFAHFFAVSVPQGVTRLQLRTANLSTGGTGDANLYVQHGKRPTTNDYYAASTGPDNEETVSVPNPEAGEWFVMLPGRTTYDGLRLVATFESAGLPTVSAVPLDSDASEPGYNKGRVRLSRTGTTSAGLTVNIGESGSALNGTDYVALPSVVSFGVGVSTVDLDITPIDDSLVEGDESVVVTVLSGTGYQVGTANVATVVIADNDVADLQRPTAQVAAGNITSGGGSTYSFTITYNDNVAMNAASVDSSDIRVTGLNGYDQVATFVSMNTGGNGSPRTATYRISAPGGTWDSTDNGSYSLSMRPNQVTDTSGNSVLEGMLASFVVNIPSPGPTIADIPDGTTPTPTGSPYTGPVPSVSGNSPYTWSLVNGPSGMVISPTTGVVSWSNPTPPSSSFLVTIRVTNAQGYDDESWYLSVPARPNPIISGRVTRLDNGAGLDAVTINFSSSGSITTTGGGYYNYQVPYGWSGLVTPSYGSGSFIAANRTYNSAVTNDQGNQNYTWTPLAKLYWQIPSGSVVRWILNTNGAIKSNSSVYSGATTWQVRGAGDIDGDGVADLIWQLPTGQVACWLMKPDGTSKSSSYLYSGASLWQVRCVGDLNGDGVADLIWQLPTGQVACWLMNSNGTQKAGVNIRTTPTTWQIRGMGDIDKDGVPDLIWQLPTGQVACWLMKADGTSKSGLNIYTGTSSWTIRGVGDVNGDGVPDLIWQLPTGQAACWLMNSNGTQKAGVNILTTPTTWQIRCAGW